MLNNNDIVKVTNRDNSIVGYYIPELNVKRNFQAQEVKELPVSEVRALAWTRGGRSVIKNHLIIDNEELIAEVLGEVEPEYFYTVKDIEELLLYGSEDQLKDALDFGYEGTTTLIKEKAVELELNDMRKRDIIFKATNFNVTNAIMINQQSNVVEEEIKTRRAAPITATESQSEATTERRAAPRYKVTSRQN